MNEREYERHGQDCGENIIEMPSQSWDAIADARLRLIEEHIEPQPSAWLRPEIAESWIRCARAGVDPESCDLAEPITEEDFRETCRIYADLIEATQPFMGMIEELDLSHDYIFELVSRNGITLLRMGNLDLHSIIAERSCMNEMTMGTNAHTLCMRCKCALSVMGVEHYCTALHGLAGIAAPIADENGVVIASLLLTQPLPPDLWSDSYRKLCAHAMGLIASTASAIEHQLVYAENLAKLARTDERLEEETQRMRTAEQVLDITVGSSTRPLLIVDGAGRIQHVSPEAVHLLQGTKPAVMGAGIEEVLGLPWPDGYRPLIDGGPGIAITAQIGSRQYDVHGNSVLGLNQEDLQGMILTLMPSSSTASKSSSKAGEEATVRFEDILGKSDAMIRARNLAARYAATGENILIIGESGTGKEYFAQAIHNASRPKGPFMSVNCAAIPPRLIESELFGYESGAFTGAERGGKPGKIELSDGGTLFLDEIGDMPLELQATLLRVLENKKVMRLGGKAYKSVDFRVVAATNRDLSAMAAEGTFREDLLYRLSILTVGLPPLRQRNGDTLFFAYYYLNECYRKAHEGPSGFSEDALALISSFGWPGNVRQMKNVVYSAFYACAGHEITADDLPRYLREGTDAIGEFSVTARDRRHAVRSGEGASAGAGFESGHESPSTRANASGGSGFGMSQAGGGMDVSEAAEGGEGTAGEGLAIVEDLVSLRDLEESAIKLALVRTEGNMTRAAELLGISKATLYRKVKEYRLK